MTARIAVALVVLLVTGCFISIDESKIRDDAGAASPDGAAPSPFGNDCGAGRVCAVAPDGWSFVSIRSGAGGDCPSGYAPLDPLVEEPTSPPALACGCKCGARQDGADPCTGSVVMIHGPGSICTGVVTIPQGSCFTFSAAIDGPTSIGVAGPLAFPRASCGAEAEVVTRGALDPAPVRLCASAEATTAAGCEQGSTCITRPATPDALCVRGPAGATSCPPRYPTMRRIAKSFRDERTCGPCDCDADDKCAPTVELYTGGGCTSLATTLTTGGCAANGTTGQLTGAKSSTTLQPGACAPDPEKPSTPQGSVVADGPVLVCCP